MVILKNEAINYKSLDNEEDIENTEKFVKQKLSSSNSNDQRLLLEQILSDFKKIKAVLYHRKIAKRQREYYNYIRKNLAEDELFIELDWKQKVCLLPEDIFFPNYQNLIIPF